MAALGVEIGMNFRVNTKLFNKTMEGMKYSAKQFTDVFSQNAADMAAKYGVTSQLIEKRVKSLVPQLGKLNDISLSAGKNFVLNRALEKTEALLQGVQDQMKESFGGFDEKGLQDIRESLAQMQTIDLKNLNDSMKKFEGSIDSFSVKQQEKMGDLFKSMQDDKTPKNLAKIAKQMKAITDNPMKELKEQFNDWVSGARRGLGYLLGFGSLIGIWNDILETQTEMSRSVWQMGKVGTEAFSSLDGASVKVAKTTLGTRAAVRKSVNDFMQMNARVATSTQASLSEVGQTMGELMRMRVGNKVAGDFESITETSVLMSKALGISSSTANNFVRDLSLIGGVGAKDIRGAAEEISVIQQNLGLSEDEVVLVGKTVGNLVRQFRTFGGGSSKDIKIVTKELSKMSAAFTSVGLSADDASSIVMSMMNPDNLQKSVLLWNSMGMNAAEGFAMMQGEGKNMEGMTKKMVNAAKDLKAQYGGNIFALKAMAEAQGLSLEQVQALSTYDDKKLDDMAKQAKLDEAAKAAQQGINDQLKRLSNQLMIILQTWLLPILKILGDILEPIIEAVAWINKMATSAKGFDKILGKILQGVSIGFALMITGILPKLGKVFGLLKGGFSGIIGNIKTAKKGITDLASGAKGFWDSMKEPKGLFSKLKAGLGSIFGKKPNIADAELPKPKQPGGTLSGLKGKGKTPSIAEVKPQPKSPIIDQLSKVSPAQLLAIGAAILMIAAGIALIVLSTVQLAKAMKDLNMEQIIGLIGVMAVIMGGMVLVIYAFAAAITALGAAGTVSALGILAIGAAILMIAGGVALIVLSITGLVKAFAELGDNAGVVAAGITSIVLSISGLIAASALLVGAIALLTYALIGASAGIAVFSASLVVLALAMPLLIGIGLAARGAGEALLNMGIGTKLMADNFEKARTGLQAFKTELGGNWKGIADGAITEIERINTALAEMQKMSIGSMAASIVTNVIGKSAGEKESANNVETSDYVTQFNTANAHLSAISQNTSKTNSLLSELISETKRSVKIRTKVSLTANMGVSD